MRRASATSAVVGLMVALPGVAGASVVSPSSRQVTSAHAAVTACGSLSGVGVSWTSTANVVTTLVLTSIPSACIGGTLSVTLTGTANAALSTLTPVTVSGATQTFSTVPSSPAATSVTGVQISVAGP